jgi:predicted nucleic acid-binding Zn ribbon protein
MTEPVRVGEVLAALPGMAERLAEARVVAAWPAIAGPAAARSRAEGVDGGILQVAVDSSGWLHRLRLQEADLLARCRATVPTSNVRAIRFRLAPPPDERAVSEGEVPR